MTSPEHAAMTGRQIRALCRCGTWNRPTTGVATRFAQANMVVLPVTCAAEFEAFCRANPKPCPLLEVTERGSYEPKSMAPESDLRTDLPRYRVYQDGELIDQPMSIETYWPVAPMGDETDLVALLIGCSFTFERALLEAGIPVRHIEEACNVPMYRTNIACTPVGIFYGPMVVSMRPMTHAQADLARRITQRYPRAHGAPIHVGDPTAIGIDCLDAPDYGDAVTVHSGEIPVFWACGVTPMEAVIRAMPTGSSPVPRLTITHEPGHMFVTDVLDEPLRHKPMAND